MVSFSSLRSSNISLLTTLFLSAVSAFPSNYHSYSGHATSSLQARQSMSSFAGTSSYYIAGLSTQERTEYLDRLRDYGNKVLRIWVAPAEGFQKGSNLARRVPDFEENGVGNYNYQALDMLDEVMKDCADRNIKVILALHNANSFGNWGHCDSYCRKYGGSAEGKNSPTAKRYYQESAGDFDNRIRAILNYKSPRFGKSWSQLSELIMAIDIENEPMVQAVEFAAQNPGNAASSWLCGRAKTIKSLVGDSIAISTGGLAGSVWASESNPYVNWADYALQCNEINVIAVHGYLQGGGGAWNDVINKANNAAKSHGKLLMVEEWGVFPEERDNFVSQARSINEHGIPWLYWEFTPGPENDKDFELSLDGSQGDNIKSMIRETNGKGIASGQEGWAKYLGGNNNAPGDGGDHDGDDHGGNPGNACGITECSWKEACFGATCSTNDDCSDSLTCNSGKCGCPK